MLSNSQIKLVQAAANAAGLRDRGQYYLLLGNYRKSNGGKVTSCKDLTHAQIDDLLAICEAYGWRHPGHAPDFYRRRVANAGDIASYAQLSAIDKLRGDLGWNHDQLSGMVSRITKHRIDSTCQMTPGEAHGLIEALKKMFSRRTGKQYGNLKQLQTDVEAKDGNKESDSKDAGQEQHTTTAAL